MTAQVNPNTSPHVRLLRMKVILAIALTFSFAQAASKKQVRHFNKLVKCLANVVDHQRGGLDAIDFAYEMLSLVEADNRDSVIQAAREECKTYKKEHAKARRYGVKYYVQYAQDIKESFPGKASDITFELASHRAMCKVAGVGFDLGLFYLVGADLQFAVCKSNLGDKFFAFLPTADVGIGGGATLLFTAHNVGYTYVKGEADYDLTAGIGIIGAMEEDDEGNRSYGVGLAYYLGTKYSKMAKLVPLKSKYQVLIDKFFN
jgi:hypothetical protein